MILILIYENGMCYICAYPYYDPRRGVFAKRSSRIQKKHNFSPLLTKFSTFLLQSHHDNPWWISVGPHNGFSRVPVICFWGSLHTAFQEVFAARSGVPATSCVAFLGDGLRAFSGVLETEFQGKEGIAKFRGFRVNDITFQMHLVLVFRVACNKLSNSSHIGSLGEG